MVVIATPIDTVGTLPLNTATSAASCDVTGVTGSEAGGCDAVVKPTVVGTNCFFDCDQVFANVQALPTIKNGTLVQWEVHPSFTDPGPYEYQLQFGRTGNLDADDWEAVGLTAFNVSFLIDDDTRLYGKTNWTHYRVCLTTPVAKYFSRPIAALGNLGFQDRRIFMEIMRAQQIQLRKSDGSEGFLLKRRLFGPPCDADCIFEPTKEVINPQCSKCFGSGFAGGYFDPVSCIYVALSPNSSHNNLDGGKVVGTIEEGAVVKGRMLAVPAVFENDVWVDKKNDHRWYIHRIKNVVELRNIPIAIDVEFRFAPFTDPIYDFEILDQIPDLLEA